MLTGDPHNPNPDCDRCDGTGFLSAAQICPACNSKLKGTRYTEEYSTEQIRAILRRLDEGGHVYGWSHDGENQWTIKEPGDYARTYTREGVERWLELRGEPQEAQATT